MCVWQIEFLTVPLLVQLLSAIRRPDITQAARLVGGWCTVVQKAKIVSWYYVVSRYLGTLCCILWYDSALYYMSSISRPDITQTARMVGAPPAPSTVVRWYVAFFTPFNDTIQ